MNGNNTNHNQGAVREFRPRLSFFHPTAKCTGSAIQFELLPACGKNEGAFMMSIANQITARDPSAAIPFARFDWENKLTVKLGFADLAKFLMVFRGEYESLEDGKGVYHKTPEFSTRIVLRHCLEPVSGYSLEVYRNGSGSETHARIFLTPWEVLGLAESIANSFGLICFGVPTAPAYMPANNNFTNAGGDRVSAA